ncbi:MAG: hypothetical protein QCI82_04740 [Candidatus Thermoplasmatota archaeon]|nr:hypothetical protein [Candidatus Thermoplasmatota archaeon]
MRRIAPCDLPIFPMETTAPMRDSEIIAGIRENDNKASELKGDMIPLEPTIINILNT